MDDKILTERDVHGLVKVFQMDSNLILNKDQLCGALGLTVGEREEIASRVQLDRSGPYTYFSLVINKWIGLNSERATVGRLVIILREENFHSTADELFKSLGMPSVSPSQTNSTSESKTLLVKKSDKTKAIETINPIPNPSITKKSEKTEKTKKPSQPEIKCSATTTKVLKSEAEIKTSDELIQSHPDTQCAQPLGSNELIHVNGSTKELLDFLRMDHVKFKMLKSLQFDNVEMRGDDFVNAIQHIKTLESIKLTNLNLTSHFDSSREILLPNMKEYVVELRRSSWETFGLLETMSNKSWKGNSLVTALIFFANANTSDELWATCLNLRYIDLQLVSAVTNAVVFKLDRVNSEFVINGMHGYSLPHFLTIINGLKKCTLKDFRFEGTNDPYSYCPSSLTHLSIFDMNIYYSREPETAFKSMNDLVSVNIAFPWGFSYPLDLSCLSPQLRYMRLGKVKIVCSSLCPFTCLGLLILNACVLHSISSKIPFMFRCVKKCYFVPARLVEASALHFKKLLEIPALELIVVNDFRYLGSLKEIRSEYGVPSNAKSFALEKTEGQWSLVSLSEESVEEIFKSVYTGGMDLRTFNNLLM